MLEKTIILERLQRVTWWRTLDGKLELWILVVVGIMRTLLHFLC
jgi:hypothetical protein